MTFLPRRALWLRHALQFADSAVRRDARSARALAVRGELLQSLASAEPGTADSLRQLAERDLRTAIALRPDAAQAWTSLAALLQSQYRYADAAEAAQRGYDADPWFDSRATLYRAFSTSLHAGAFANSARWCSLGLEHYANDARFIECRLTLLGWNGSSPAAVQEASRIVASIERADTLSRLSGTWGYRRLMVAAVAARAGMRDTARAILAEVRSSSVPDSLRGNSDLGESYVMLLLGNRDSSLSILQQYATTPRQRSMVRSHPWFVSLREDPRFRELTGTP
jgi:tetratricopeptide (TPR) repeat protein